MLGGLLISPLAQAQCTPQQEAKLTQIESQLLQFPNNRILQAAYHFITQACQHESITHYTQWHTQITLAYGQSSNPLQLSKVDHFTLTLPQQTLLLANPNKPKAQTYHQWQITTQSLASHYSLNFQAQQTQWHASNLKDERQWQLSLQPQPSQSPIQPQLYLSQFQTQTQMQTTFGLQLIYPIQSKSWRAQVGLFTQKYQDSHYNQNLIQAQVQYLTAAQQLTLLLQQAKPTQGSQSRAGGIQNSLLLSWQQNWTLPQPWQAQTQLSYKYTQDTQGYSSYLKRNQKRHTQLMRLNASLSYPLIQRLNLQLLLQETRQQSNLSLFQWQQQQYTLQFQVRF